MNEPVKLQKPVFTMCSQGKVVLGGVLTTSDSGMEMIKCDRKHPRRVSFQLDANGEVCVQVLGQAEPENEQEELIIQNKVRLTYSRGQIDPIRVMQAKDQIMEKLTKRTKGEIREWPPNNRLNRSNHLGNKVEKKDDDNDGDDIDDDVDRDLLLLEDEIRRAGLVQYDGSYQPWFFGKITRRESEAFLAGTTAGTFLIRLSENTACCYTLSIRKDSGSCRHFLIMMTTEPGPSEYKLLGSYQSFGTLSSLVQHHGHSPITKSGNECLRFPCPRPKDFKVTF